MQPAPTTEEKAYYDVPGDAVMVIRGNAPALAPARTVSREIDRAEYYRLGRTRAAATGDVFDEDHGTGVPTPR